MLHYLGSLSEDVPFLLLLNMNSLKTLLLNRMKALPSSGNEGKKTR